MDIPKSKEERRFLEGPHSRWEEFVFLIKVVLQFMRGLRSFHFLGPCVTVFGSARFKEGNPHYELTRKVSAEISNLGFTIMTGGGPGLMEAANRGAKEAGGRSVGCNIILPHEQQHNSYLDKWVSIDYFFVRKVLLSKYSYAFIVMPGGYGTLDEFFEAITLIQTKKTKNFPIVLMGTEFHKDLIAHIETMIKVGTINAEDKDLFLFTDDVSLAIQHLQKFAIDAFKLSDKKTYKPIWFLREQK